jgi:hypothetical protein
MSLLNRSSVAVAIDSWKAESNLVAPRPHDLNVAIVAIPDRQDA